MTAAIQILPAIARLTPKWWLMSKPQNILIHAQIVDAISESINHDPPPVPATALATVAAAGNAMRQIAIIEGSPITELDDLSVTYTAGAMIDGDGSGDSHGDPDFQNNTSLKIHGSALNADIDRYIVVPPAIIHGVRGIVLGCKARVSYNGLTVDAVVGDIGPHLKLGEISIACAKALNIPSSPLTGGVDYGVHYVLWPGIAAPGYQLQAS